MLPNAVSHLDPAGHGLLSHVQRMSLGRRMFLQVTQGTMLRLAFSKGVDLF